MRTASYAVMFTDIKGFTERTSQQTRAQNARLLRLHDALLLPVIHGYGGRRVKTIGDAYLVIFDSTTRALACGAALQDRLAIYNRYVSDHDRIEVRVAVNAGEVRVADDDVYGEAVNIAARVEEVADAGEVCFSEAAYLLADRSWIQVEELGPHTLKGIPEPVRLFRLRRSPTAEFPYGGAALATLNLPDPRPETLARWQKGFWRLKRIGWFAVSLTALLAGGLAAWMVWNSPVHRVERALEKGRVEEARAVLAEATFREAERAYVEGVIAQASGNGATAVRHLERAAKADAKLAAHRIPLRLIPLLGHSDCEVRSQSARILGEIGGKDAIGALKELAEREPPPGSGLLGIKLGGCNAGDAARGALKRLEG